MSDQRVGGAVAPEPKVRVRPQLDPRTILDAALRLAADGGTEPLTVRRLGRELGADPTAIYRHFRDKDELVRGALDLLIADSVARVDPEQPWRARLGTLAEVSLEILCAHPTIGAEAAIQTTGGPGELAAVDLIIRAMKEAGLAGHEAVRFYAVFASHVLSFSSARARSTTTLADGLDAAEARWIGGSAALRQNRFSALVDVRDELEALRDDDIYRAGVDVILDAVAARAAQTPHA